MNRIFKSGVVLFIILCIVISCEGSDSDPVKPVNPTPSNPDPVVPVTPVDTSKPTDPIKEYSVAFVYGTDKTPVVSSGEGSFKVSFNSSHSWSTSLSDSCDWLTVSPLSGDEGKGTVTVVYKENETYDDRCVGLKILCGTAVDSLVITQKQKDSFSCTSSDTRFDGDGGVFSLNVLHNVSFEYCIESDATSWIKPIETKSLSNSTIQFNISEYSGEDIRQGTITISSALGKEKYIVFQSGKPVAKQQFSSNGGSFSFIIPAYEEITTNFSPESASQWLTVSPQFNLDSLFYVVTVSCGILEGSISTRSANVNVDCGEKTYSVNVSQQDYLKCNITKYDIDKDTKGQLRVDVETNAEISVDTGCDWLKYDSFDRENSQLILLVGNNRNGWDRSTEMRISLAGKPEVFCRIKINQEGGYHLYFHSPFILSSEGESFANINKWLVNTAPSLKWGYIPVNWTDNQYAPENSSEVTRSIHASLRDQNDNEMEVFFLQMPKGVLSPTQGSHQRGYEGSYFAVGLPESAEYDISVKDDWISPSGYKHFRDNYYGDHKYLYFKIKENTKRDSRSTTIIFDEKQYGLHHELKIVQDGKPEVVGNDWKTVPFTSFPLYIQIADSGSGTDLPKSFDTGIKTSSKVVLFTTNDKLMIPNVAGFTKQLELLSDEKAIIDYLKWFDNYKANYYDHKKKTDFYGTASGIAMNSHFVGNRLDIDCSLYFKLAGDYKLMVFITEDDIEIQRKSILPNGVTYTYVLDYNSVARACATDIVSGDDIVVSGNNEIKYRKYSVTIPADCNKNKLNVVAYVLRQLGDNENVFGESHGEWFVDNSATATAGTKLELALDRYADEEGNSTPINEGGKIDVQ